MLKDAIRTFNELENLGLEKNMEAMNSVLDRLCKEGQINQARKIFSALKPRIFHKAPTSYIFIHGCCKLNQVSTDKAKG